MSQFQLAMHAGSTPRHISFIETGRSRPSQDMIVRLASAMAVPLRQRNALLLAAGLKPIYPERALDAPEMAPFRAIVDTVLRGHPYPAWVSDRYFTIHAANAPAERMFPGLTQLSPEQLVDMWFGPGPFRKVVENWAEMVWAAVEVLRRDVREHPEPKLAELLARVEAHAVGVPRPDADEDQRALPILCPRFVFEGQTVQTVTTVMRFDTAREVTLSDVKVELMYPVDAAGEAFFAKLLSSAPS